MTRLWHSLINLPAAGQRADDHRNHICRIAIPSSIMRLFCAHLIGVPVAAAALPASEQRPQVCVGVSLEQGMARTGDATAQGKIATSWLVSALNRKIRSDIKDSKVNIPYRAVSGIGIYPICDDVSIERVILSYRFGATPDEFKIKLLSTIKGQTFTELHTRRVSDLQPVYGQTMKFELIPNDIRTRSTRLFSIIRPILEKTYQTKL
jgi:hypothetical protein